MGSPGQTKSIQSCLKEVGKNLRFRYRPVNSRLDHPDLQGKCFFIFLVMATLWFLNGYQSVFDVDPFDESIYLSYATQEGIRSAWGPLYVSYYRALLALFAGDALFVYYFNIGLLSALIPILHYLLLRRLLVSPFLSFLSSYYLLIASFGAPLMAKAGHFNLLILYTGLLAASWIKSRFTLYLFLVIPLIPTLFVRQEMLVALALVLIALGYVIGKSSQKKLSYLTKSLVAIVIVASIHLSIFGNIFGSDRSWPVFSSVFFLNFTSPTNLQRVEFVESTFGKVNSISAAYRANSPAFWQHVRINLKKLPEKIPGL